MKPLIPALLMLALAIGCEDGRAPAPSMRYDAGIAPDAGPPAMYDAGATPDAGPGTDGGHEVPAGACTFSAADQLVLASTHVWSDAPAVAVRNEGALVAWVAAIDGQPRISTLWFPADGAPPAALSVSTDESQQRQPALTTTDAGYLAVWSDDRDGDFEIVARAVSAAGIAADDLIVLTDNDVPDEHPAVASNGSDALVAWRERGERTIGRTRLVRSDAMPTGPARLIAGLGEAMGTAAMSAYADGFALAWVDDEQRVQWLTTRNNGTATGPVVRVDAEGNAVGTIDVGEGVDGGGVVFDVRVADLRPEVRFRPIDTAGAPGGRERVLTPAPETGLAASISALRGGFIVAYQADEEETSHLRLAISDPEGTALDWLDIAELTAPPARTVVRASPDGRFVYLVWVDGSRMTFAKVRCA